MNTRNRPGRSTLAGTQQRCRPHRLGRPFAPASERPGAGEPRPAPAGVLGAAGPRLSAERRAACRHPLSDLRDNERLLAHEQSLRERFGAIPQVLKRIAAEQHSVDFVDHAQQLAREELGFELPEQLLAGAWVGGLDMRALYGAAVLATMRLVAEQVRTGGFTHDSGSQEAAVSFFLDCGYHAVDISPCSDGRLKGLIRYILRLPDEAIRTRKAYAGAMFDVEANVQRWIETELLRYRECRPVGPSAESRYLKIAVYHWSSSDPRHMGCAAHGSNQRRAAAAALRRLREFREAIQNRFCCGASVDILLIGVDTDTDSIKVHVPDGDGELSLHRVIDSLELYDQTLSDDPNTAYLKVYQAISDVSAEQGWGAGQGEPSEGMRRLVATLLVNNFSQIDYVCATRGGRYPDIGHAEHFISVGDGFEEFQLRNIAYYAHLQTLEEGTGDMDVGVGILEQLSVPLGLPVVVAVHFRFDSRVPGSRDRTVEKCRRVASAIRARYADLAQRGLLVCGMTVQDQLERSPIEVVDCEPAARAPRLSISGLGSVVCVDERRAT